MQEVSSHICVFFLGKNLIKTLGILDKHTLVKYQYKKTNKNTHQRHFFVSFGAWQVLILDPASLVLLPTDCGLH